MTKRTIQRTALVVALLLLSVFLFYIGKSHTLLLDTHAITIDGKTYSVPDALEVSVDGKEPESMSKAERALVNVGGPWHTIIIQLDDEDGGESVKKIVRKITIPTFIDTSVVSISAMIGDAPESSWLQIFTAAATEDAPAEQMVMQDDEEDEEDTKTK